MGRKHGRSRIADLFSKNERPCALGVYAIGTYLGVFLGYFIGGYVNQHYGPMFALCMPTSDFTTMVAAGRYLVPGRLPPRPDLCDRADGCKTEHAGAGFRHHVADGGPLAVGTLNDALKNDYGARALLAAVGGGLHHGRGLAVHLAGAVDPGRHPTGELT